MSRRNRKNIPNNRRLPLNLDNVGETSDTPRGRSQSRKNDKSYEDIPPVFQGSNTNEEYIKKTDVSLVVKVIVIAISILGFLSAAIWFSAGISGDVDRLKVDVLDVKKQTELIFIDTRKNEKNIDKLSNEFNHIKENQKKTPNNKN